MKKNRNKKIRVSSLRIYKVKMRRRRILSNAKTYQQVHLEYLLNYSGFINSVNKRLYHEKKSE